MTAESKRPGTVNVLVPVGSLGAGVQEADVRYGLAVGAHAIASDAGSTDSGAAYLALGISKYNREAVERDLRILIGGSGRGAHPFGHRFLRAIGRQHGSGLGRATSPSRSPESSTSLPGSP